MTSKPAYFAAVRAPEHNLRSIRDAPLSIAPRCLPLLVLSGCFVARILRMSNPRRRWYQFSLRTLLIAMAVLSVLLGLWMLSIARAERQRRAVRAVDRLGGSARYANVPVGESWLITQLRKTSIPRDYFDPVVEISLGNTQCSDADLRQFSRLSKLQYLQLNNTEVTDAGLLHISGLTKLERLELAHTSVTSSGLAHLQRLDALTRLGLARTQVSDEGLAYLRNLKQLECLYLFDTQVTDSGLVHLANLSKLHELWLPKTRITNAGVCTLQRLPNLRSLNLSETAVTDAGLVYFEKFPQLEWLGLSGTDISDVGIGRLRGSKLKRLLLLDTPVTAKQVAQIQEQLPNCSVFFGPSP